MAARVMGNQLAWLFRMPTKASITTFLSVATQSTPLLWCSNTDGFCEESTQGFSVPKACKHGNWFPGHHQHAAVQMVWTSGTDVFVGELMTCWSFESSTCNISVLCLEPEQRWSPIISSTQICHQINDSQVNIQSVACILESETDWTVVDLPAWIINQSTQTSASRIHLTGKKILTFYGWDSGPGNDSGFAFKWESAQPHSMLAGNIAIKMRDFGKRDCEFRDVSVDDLALHHVSNSVACWYIIRNGRTMVMASAYVWSQKHERPKWKDIFCDTKLQVFPSLLWIKATGIQETGKLGHVTTQILWQLKSQSNTNWSLCLLPCQSIGETHHCINHWPSVEDTWDHLKQQSGHVLVSWQIFVPQRQTQGPKEPDLLVLEIAFNIKQTQKWLLGKIGLGPWPKFCLNVWDITTTEGVGIKCGPTGFCAECQNCLCFCEKGDSVIQSCVFCALGLSSSLICQPAPQMFLSASRGVGVGAVDGYQWFPVVNIVHNLAVSSLFPQLPFLLTSNRLRDWKGAVHDQNHFKCQTRN